jgi:CIC family chloride channel protein
MARASLAPTVTPLGRSVGQSLTHARMLLLVSMPLGVLVGTAIAGYDWVVNELFWRHVTEQRLALQIAAPILGMFLAGLLIRWGKATPAMADEVVNAYHEPEAGMPTGTAAAKLAASVATMGFGGSAGMEGASKWLGATIGSWLQGRLNRTRVALLHANLKTTLIAGGSAGIAAIFRAPLSGAIMGIESPYKHDLALEALLPALVASATSFWAFTRLRPATPYFPIHFHYALSTRDLLIAIPLGVSAGLGSHLFLGSVAWCRRRFSAVASIPLRTALGGVLLSGIALGAWRLYGSPLTLQSGLPVANDLLNGRYALMACVVIFFLKVAATSVTFGSGGVGGWFVPTATIGAAIGACWDAALHTSPPGVYTLLGIAAFSAASYNSLLFSAVFIAEASGNVFLVVPALIASTFAFVTSAGVSNSRAQRAHRPDARDLLDGVPLAAVMTTRIVTVEAPEPLTAFAHSLLLEHHFRALPVIDAQGTFLGMVGLAQLRGVPMRDWAKVRVNDVMDARARTLCPDHSAADAERLLRDTGADYVPVVDPATYQLVGVVSSSDLDRARSTRTLALAA